MKKSEFVAVLSLGLAFFVTGCASTSSLPREQFSPAAIISITGTNLVSWEDKTINDNDENTSKDGALNALLNKTVDRNNPEITTAVDRLDYADDAFRHILPEIAGIKVLDKSSVVDADIYKYTYGSFYNSLSDSTQASGYKDMSVIGSKKARMLLSELGAKSLVSMDFTFRKILASGNRQNGQVAALVDMKVKVLDSNGREAVNKVYTRQSAQTVMLKGGYYNKSELVTLINSVIDDAITAFAVEYSDGSSFDGDLSDGSVDVNAQAETTAESLSSGSAPATKLGKPKTSSHVQLSTEEALEQKAEETAANLIKMGLETGKIAEATGLSVEKVKEIGESLKTQDLQTQAQQPQSQAQKEN